MRILRFPSRFSFRYPEAVKQKVAAPVSTVAEQAI